MVVEPSFTPAHLVPAAGVVTVTANAEPAPLNAATNAPATTSLLDMHSSDLGPPQGATNCRRLGGAGDGNATRGPTPPESVDYAGSSWRCSPGPVSTPKVEHVLVIAEGIAARPALTADLASRTVTTAFRARQEGRSRPSDLDLRHRQRLGSSRWLLCDWLAAGWPERRIPPKRRRRRRLPRTSEEFPALTALLHEAFTRPADADAVSTAQGAPDYIPLGAAAFEAQRADAWTEALPQLTRFVRSLGVSPEDAEDVVQETATRALAHAIPYTDAQDLLRWCQVTARHLVVDGHRTSRRHIRLVDCDMAMSSDVHDTVQTRMALQQVLAAVEAQLPGAEQRAIADLLTDAAAPTCRRSQVKSAVARNRARNRLKAIVGYPWVVAPATAILHWSRRASRVGGVVSVTSAAAALSLVLGHTPQDGAHIGASPVTPRSLAIKAVSHRLPLATPSARLPRTPKSPTGHVAPSNPSSAPDEHVAHVKGPVGTDVDVSHRAPQQGDHLLCTGGDGTLPLTQTLCVG